jgi:hypothetical protein
MTNSDLHVVSVPQLDPRLGRQVVHDPQSRRFAFPLGALPDKPTKPIRHRIWGPRTTPSQKIGCCTLVDQAVKANAAGNRQRGVILDLAWCEKWYPFATRVDPFPGEWPPTDTGSSGLAGCKAAVEAGVIERYEWLFGGARQVLAALAGGEGKKGRCVGVGAWWMADMFSADPETLLVKPTGGRVGGHQWTVTGWAPHYDAFEGLCWWGEGFGQKGRFRIRFDDLDALLADDGDAHVTYRAGL